MMMRQKKQFDVLSSKMRETRADLRCVDLSDVLIAYIPKNTPLCGTIHEIVVAAESKAYTFDCRRWSELASNWFWGMLPTAPHTEGRSGWIFDSWESFFTFMDEVDDETKSIPQPKQADGHS